MLSYGVIFFPTLPFSFIEFSYNEFAMAITGCKNNNKKLQLDPVLASAAATVEFFFKGRGKAPREGKRLSTESSSLLISQDTVSKNLLCYRTTACLSSLHWKTLAKYSNKIFTMLNQTSNHLHIGTSLTSQWASQFKVHPHTQATGIWAILSLLLVTNLGHIYQKPQKTNTTLTLNLYDDFNISVMTVALWRN